MSSSGVRFLDPLGVELERKRYVTFLTRLGEGDVRISCRISKQASGTSSTILAPQKKIISPFQHSLGCNSRCLLAHFLRSTEKYVILARNYAAVNWN